ncbi:MAG: exosortase-associated EpsI family protein [Verrucomicrobiota bacterium]
MSKMTIASLQDKSLQPDASSGIKLVWWHYVVPVIVAGLAIVICMLSPETNSATQSGVIMELPQYIGNYIGVDKGVSLAEKQILPGDTEFERKLYHKLGDEILCSIVLAGGEKRSIHRPQVCLPGQGWTLRSETVRQVILSDGRTIEVTDLALSREVPVGPDQTRVIRSHYFYFYVGKGIVTPDSKKRVFLTSWDRVVRGLNHRWAYVIVTSTVTEDLKANGKNSEQTINMLKEFTAQVAPQILQDDIR